MTSLTDITYTGSILNLPAMFVVGLATTMLVIGIKASAQFNAVMVVIKLVIVVLVIAFGLPLIMGDNLEPFIPPNTGTWGEFGWSGVFRATGVIFFAYIGFDAVSVAAQEARNPQRDMPIGILGSLLICTLLYILVSGIATGIFLMLALVVAFAFKSARRRELAVGVGLHNVWLRKAAKGEPVAVLLDGAQAEALASLPFAADLEMVARSAPVPTSLVATVGTRLPAARWALLERAFLSAAGDPGGAAALAGVRMVRFAPVDAAALGAARALAGVK